MGSKAKILCPLCMIGCISSQRQCYLRINCLRHVMAMASDFNAFVAKCNFTHFVCYLILMFNFTACAHAFYIANDRFLCKIRTTFCGK